MKMTKEQDIQNLIKDIINRFYGRCWRANAGVFKSFDGKRIVQGLPKGFPDLFGFRRRDGKMFFLEVKSKKGKRTEEQERFEQMLNENPNILYGVVKSLDDALKVLEVGEYKK